MLRRKRYSIKAGPQSFCFFPEVGKPFCFFRPKKFAVRKSGQKVLKSSFFKNTAYRLYSPILAFLFLYVKKSRFWVLIKF
jgi:hypothetical protein